MNPRISTLPVTLGDLVVIRDLDGQETTVRVEDVAPNGSLIVDDGEGDFNVERSAVLRFAPAGTTIETRVF